MCRTDPIGRFSRGSRKLFINSLSSPRLYSLPRIAPSDTDDLGFTRYAVKKVRIVPFIAVRICCDDTGAPTGLRKMSHKAKRPVHAGNPIRGEGIGDHYYRFHWIHGTRHAAAIP